MIQALAAHRYHEQTYYAVMIEMRRLIRSLSTGFATDVFFFEGFSRASLPEWLHFSIYKKISIYTHAQIIRISRREVFMGVLECLNS